MSTTTLTARVRKDGSLGISKQQRDIIGLVEGQEFDITFDPRIISAASRKRQSLMSIIGIANDGDPNGSEQIDQKTYQSDVY